MSRSAPTKPGVGAASADSAPSSSTSTERNQYIPSFIASKPFYASSLDDSDYLQHQRLKAEPKDTLDKAKWYERGKKAGPAATKYRKGACENCGSASHKTKECLYRPRKTGAKWTGKDIQADEVVESVNLGWDAKRDRWNGYDAREYDQVVQDYNELETLKKASSATKKAEEGSESVDVDGDGDGDRIAEETAMGRTQPTSTRQLRLREDTANYLRDLDLEGAKYDPKTRSMAGNATTKTGEEIDVSDGFVRKSEAEAFERAQRYAWETQQQQQQTASVSDASAISSSMGGTGTDAAKKLHLQANPTEGLLLLKKKESADAEAKAARQKYLAEKYGTALPPSTSGNGATGPTSGVVPGAAGAAGAGAATAAKGIQKIATSEKYIEYDELTGRPKPNPNHPSSAAAAAAAAGHIKAVPRSKYAEDILQNNHKAVWGSWWRNFQWGYACCHSTVRNSYCTGEEGRLAFERVEARAWAATTTATETTETTSKSNGGDNSKKRGLTEEDDDDDDDDDPKEQEHKRSDRKKSKVDLE